MPIACGLVVIHQEISEHRCWEMSFSAIRSRGTEITSLPLSSEKYYGHNIVGALSRYWCQDM